jgi:small subunit ribosomal protein S17
MPKRILQGTVTSDKNEQTITVLVERRFKHPLLQKTVRKSKKYRAHDALNQFKIGDFENQDMDRRDRSLGLITAVCP